MRSSRRTTIAALAATAAVLFTGISPASAAGSRITMPNCCSADEVAAGDAVFVLDLQSPGGGGTEAATLVRIDPASNNITGELRLPSGTPAGNTPEADAMAAAAGSIWIAAYFHNEVLRVNPDTMQITARIHVGRGPGSVVTDGRSVWVVVQTDGYLDRIDPATNAVVQTVTIGRRGGTDFLYQAAWDGSQILVSLPGSGRVAHVDVTRGRVTGYDAVGYDAASCARILPAPGGYWLDDTICSYSYFRWDAGTAQITAQIDPEPRNDLGSVVVGNAIYTGEFHCGDTGCTRGFLVKYDAVTGARLAQRVIDDDDALLPHFVNGTFWVGHWDAGTLQRVALF